jgi:hypothetical protein
MTKVHWLLLFLQGLLFITTSCLGQQYQSIFGSHSTQWTIGHSYYHGSNTFVSNYRVVKDTVVDGKTYKKVAAQNPMALPGIVTFLLREDRDSGKVWMRHFKGLEWPGWGCYAEDRLIMDFSLQKGDTFRPLPAAIPVDTAYVQNGRRHVKLVDAGEMIEGVGLTSGFHMADTCYNLYFDYLSGHGLICMEKDGVRQYGTDCYSTGFPVSVEEIGGSSVTVYPNPAQEFLVFRTAHNAIGGAYKIRDMHGRSVLSGQIAGVEQQVSLQGLPAGVYLLVVDHFGTATWVKK